MYGHSVICFDDIRHCTAQQSHQTCMIMSHDIRCIIYNRMITGSTLQRTERKVYVWSLDTWQMFICSILSHAVLHSST